MSEAVIRLDVDIDELSVEERSELARAVAQLDELPDEATPSLVSGE